MASDVGATGVGATGEPSISSHWSVVCKSIPRTCPSNRSRSFSLFFGVRPAATSENEGITLACMRELKRLYDAEASAAQVYLYVQA